MSAAPLRRIARFIVTTTMGGRSHPTARPSPALRLDQAPDLQICDNLWAQTVSNRRHPPCKTSPSKPLTCRNTPDAASGLRKSLSAVLPVSGGFSTSCVLNPCRPPQVPLRLPRTGRRGMSAARLRGRQRPSRRHVDGEACARGRVRQPLVVSDEGRESRTNTQRCAQMNRVEAPYRHRPQRLSKDANT